MKKLLINHCRLNQVFGLGLAFEFITVCNDFEDALDGKFTETWTVMNWKIYLLPLLIHGHLRVTPKRFRDE